jgi:arylsulfatase A-like enzyme
MKRTPLRILTALSTVVMGLTVPDALFGAATPAQGGEKKPNILFIVADDLGWKDVGFHGSDIKTPTIDSLAAGGVRLEQYYVQPMCTPTRAALMTGRYPLRYGLQTGVIPSGHTWGLPTDEWLLPQALKEAGYKTAIIGKWHLGHADQKYWPRQRGFDYQYGPLIGELDYFTHEQHGVVDWYRNNKKVMEKGYTTTLLGNDAVKLINEHDPATPLYLYLAFNAPHSPYQATPEYLDRYKQIADPSRRAYAGSITAMDDQIARVLAALDKKKMRENTLIVFMSDNGGTFNKMFAGEGDMSKIKIPCDNGPYREGKASIYEGGTRVAALANWPGHIKAGGAVDQMIHVVDWYPTLVGLAGGQTGKAKPLDGMNVWPTVSEGKPSPRTEIVYNVEPFRAGIRQGDWKMIWRTMLPAAVELYNIAQDPSEKNNVAAQNPDKVAALQKRANELAAAMAKPMLLQTEIGAMMKRLKMPPSLPAELDSLDQER